MPWYVLVPLLLVGLVALLFALGSLVARDHVATCTIELRASPAQVWAALTDWRAFPQWRRNVQRVEPFAAPDGRQGWCETSDWGRLPLVVESSEPERQLVARIADDKLPFGGTWTYRLEPLPGGGTRFSITEDGFVAPPLFRLLARFVFGYHKTLADWQQMLAAKFGESARPVRS